jgi:hypothetical protein
MYNTTSPSAAPISGDYAAGATGTYWDSTNGTYYNSAKSYVPEIPWNDSCGSVVTAIYFMKDLL